MANVLIIATDRMIGGLLGQLTDLTGHAAQFRCDWEEPSGAVRHSAPEIVLVDAAYGAGTLDAVGAAAADVEASVVHFAPALGQDELRQIALARGCKYFPLPAGPRLLARVLAAALAERHARLTTDGPSLAQCVVAGAMVAVARARMLVERSSSTRMESRALRSEHHVALANCRRSYASLREAVMAYVRELRSAGMPPDRTLEMVKSTLRGEIEGSPPVSTTDSEIDDAVEWFVHAYYAA